MASTITFLSLSPTATFLHIPASTSSSFVAAPGILTSRRRAAPRALPLRARPLRRVTVVCSGAAAAAEASDAAAPAEKFRLDNLGPQKGSRRRPKRMHIGLPKYVPFNLKDIVRGGFKDGDELSLETLKSRGLINPSGRERKLPLKILGDGDVSVKLNIKAGAFSASAKEKLEAAGCNLTLLPKRKKWLSQNYLKNQARAEEYFAKKKAGAGESDGTSA
ncbi:hypothetical protein PVAP13_9NG639000 [Panicum virgatum]|uniref:Large ribosomal subunit protein uL15/eL18 domain-containing protein n=1 Tax=Panicum virgatum TaxID=38727 RepID=A0A8T0MZR7_PANVG|nr:hypothetical protein PVAP13_9NG639000 [Panicum virgatum]